MSDNKEAQSQEIEAHTDLFQNQDPDIWFTDPVADSIEALLSKAEAGQTLNLDLSVNLVKLREWHKARWAQARPHSVADKIYVNAPNPWLSEYPAEQHFALRYHGKNEANNPLNKIYNGKILELSRQWDGYTWDEYEEGEERFQAQLATWDEMEWSLIGNWTRYVDSGLAGKLSFDDFLAAYRNIKMIIIRELVEREGRESRTHTCRC